MRFPVTALKKIWGLYWYFILLSLFVLLYPGFAVTLSRRRWYRYGNLIRVLWSLLLFLFTGIYLKISREKTSGHTRKIKKRKTACILCANHTSYLDIPALMIAVPVNYRFMAKAELLKIPIFNIFFKTVDIPVDRSSRTDAGKAYLEAAESLDEGMSIVMFPEGGTSRIAPQLMKFKDGPFKLAIEKKVPIIPVTFLDNWKLFPNDGRHSGRPGVARVVVHAPVTTEHLREEDMASLKEKVYSIIHKTLLKDETGQING